MKMMQPMMLLRTSTLRRIWQHSTLMTLVSVWTRLKVNHSKQLTRFSSALSTKRRAIKSVNQSLATVAQTSELRLTTSLEWPMLTPRISQKVATRESRAKKGKPLNKHPSSCHHTNRQDRQETELRNKNSEGIAWNSQASRQSLWQAS